MELWEEIAETERQLDQALATFRENGLNYCEMERLYQMEKSKTIFKLTSEGVPTTLIPHVIKGMDGVADYYYERNKADVVYRANMEAINVKKKELDVLKAQYEREYSKNE